MAPQAKARQGAVDARGRGPAHERSEAPALRRGQGARRRGHGALRPNNESASDIPLDQRASDIPLDQRAAPKAGLAASMPTDRPRSRAMSRQELGAELSTAGA